jgi:hypothetical protein
MCLVVLLALALWVHAGRPNASEAVNRIAQGTRSYVFSGDAVTDAERLAVFVSDLVRLVARSLKQSHDQ